MSAPTHTNVGYRYRGVLLPDGVTDAHLRSAGICLIKELNSDVQHVVASQLRAAREVEDAPSPRFNFQAEEDDVSEDRRKGFQPAAVAAYLTANNKTDAPMASTDKVATAGDDATGDDTAMDEVAIEVVDSDVDMDISDDEQDGEYTLEYPDDEPQIQVLNYGAWEPMSADSQASVSANIRQPSAHSDYEAPPSSSVSSSSASVAGTPPMTPVHPFRASLHPSLTRPVPPESLAAPAQNYGRAASPQTPNLRLKPISSASTSMKHRTPTSISAARHAATPFSKPTSTTSSKPVSSASSHSTASTSTHTSSTHSYKPSSRANYTIIPGFEPLVIDTRPCLWPVGVAFDTTDEASIDRLKTIGPNLARCGEQVPVNKTAILLHLATAHGVRGLKSSHVKGCKGQKNGEQPEGDKATSDQPMSGQSRGDEPMAEESKGAEAKVATEEIDELEPDQPEDDQLQDAQSTGNVPQGGQPTGDNADKKTAEELATEEERESKKPFFCPICACGRPFSTNGRPILKETFAGAPPSAVAGTNVSAGSNASSSTQTDTVDMRSLAECLSPTKSTITAIPDATNDHVRQLQRNSVSNHFMTHGHFGGRFFCRFCVKRDGFRDAFVYWSHVRSQHSGEGKDGKGKKGKKAAKKQ